MSLRNAQPHPFSPAGLSDTLDELQAFPGACSILTNLIPDTTTKNTWIARPAAVQLTDFTGFSAPQYISCMTVVGHIIYGMIGTNRNLGHDEPFAFDINSLAFQTVSGVTALNTPTTQATAGDWTPPTMAMVGARLFVTHPGYTGAGGNYFGWFDLSTPGSPVWNAGNTTGTALTAVPVAVAAYMDRAWFAVNLPNTLSATYFTDTGGSINLSNPTQVLTFGDNIPITALKGMPLTNMLGGIVQSLIVFKGSTSGVYNIYQITGDAAQSTTTNLVGTSSANPSWDNTKTNYAGVIQSTLQINSLNIATTTLAPNTVASTPKGLLFVSPEGLRLIDQQGRVQDPIGADGGGINNPFLFITSPSRVNAATTAAVFRVSFQNNFVAGSPWQEYWFDLIRGRWSGPHSLPSYLIASAGNTFITAPQGLPGKLFRSDPYQSTTSTFIENNLPMTFNLQTSLMADMNGMCEFSAVETEVNMSLGSGTQVLVSAYDEQNLLIGSFTYPSPGAQTFWGNFTWGQANWGGVAGTLRPRRIDWAAPLVYRRLSIGITGLSSSFLRLSTINVREEKLGYIQQVP